ncbi:MAG: prephenate dehydrogenase/arogenate dehydrogenase family protein [Betaproteobacteria bacterium]
MSAPSLSKLVVFGVGLIGGSFALALRQAGAVREVIGIGRDPSNLETARRSGIADRTYSSQDKWQRELADADLVLAAVPVGQMRGVFAQIAPHLGAHSVITDAGSTKQDVIAAARATLGSAFARYVPAHPIAGTEHSGAAAAFDTLFEGRSVLLTPVTETAAQAIALVEACWVACGARVARLDAARHDQLFAAVSHLPHALAFGLVGALAGRPDRDEYFRHAASGFRDFTRLASSHPEMWRDIFVANRTALRAELVAYGAELERIGRLLDQDDGGAALAAYLAAARDARVAWLRAHAGDDAV